MSCSSSSLVFAFLLFSFSFQIQRRKQQTSPRRARTAVHLSSSNRPTRTTLSSRRKRSTISSRTTRHRARETETKKTKKIHGLDYPLKKTNSKTRRQLFFSTRNLRRGHRRTDEPQQHHCGFAFAPLLLFQRGEDASRTKKTKNTNFSF